MKTLEELCKELHVSALYNWIEYKVTEYFRDRGWEEETEERLIKAFKDAADDGDVDWEDLWNYYYY